MKAILAWIMVICVMAGLNARVLATNASHAGTCTQAEVVCCDHSHEESPADCQHDGEKCPKDHHHHHGCCSVAQPLAVGNDHFFPLSLLDSSLLGVRPEGDALPEEPFLSSEKPPLI
jgi:hypothetical protein